MRKIANILTNSKKNKFDSFFNVVGSQEDLIPGIPTLVIGLENAKEYINGFSIINKQYGDIWWTFTKTERRCEYEDDILSFYKFAILNEMKKTKYIYVDIIKFKLSNIKKIIKFLGDDTKKYIFLTRNSNFMFVYSEQYNTVFGISLELCEYLGYNKQRIYRLLRNREYIHDTKFITPEIRKVIGFNTHYILPLYTFLK